MGEFAMFRLFQITSCLSLSLLLSVVGRAQVSKISSAKQHLESASSAAASGDAAAEKEFRKAIELRDGIYPEAWLQLSLFLRKNLRFTDSLQALETALKQKPQLLSTWEKDLGIVRRAAELQARDSSGEVLPVEEMIELVNAVDTFAYHEAAKPYAERAVVIYPQSSSALITLASLIKWDERERAMDLFNRAVSLKSSDPLVYIARGRGFCWIEGDGYRAEADFRKAIALSNGLNIYAWQGLGDALARQGRRNEAIMAYEKYLAMRPENLAFQDLQIKRSIAALRTQQ